MTDFTPLTATIGGIMIGLSAGLLWLTNGRTAGVSGVFGGLVPIHGGDFTWRLAFLIALPVGALIGLYVAPSIFSEVSGTVPEMNIDPVAMIVSGLMVGAGTRLGGGCTSGHGICGLARFSVRSAAAVGIFMATGIATVFVVRHVL